MTVDDDEIQRVARRWLEQYGKEAIAKARDVVAVARAAGNHAGADDWLRIIVAIEEVRRGT